MEKNICQYRFIYTNYLIITLVLILMITGCSNKIEGQILFLSFDDNSESIFTEDDVTNVKYEIKNVFNNAIYKDSTAAYRIKGVSGNALNFDGYSTYLDLGNLLSNTNTFSVNTWISLRAYDYPDSNWNPIIENYSLTNSSGFIFGYTDYGKWGLKIRTNNGWYDILCEEKINLYTWYNIGFSFNGQLIELYLNGEKVKTYDLIENNSSYIIPSDATILIGRNSFNQTGNVYSFNGFCGALDELRIFSIPLNQSDQKKYFDEYSKESSPYCDYQTIAYPSDYLSTDLYRYTYHAGPYVNWISDMCGIFKYNDNYHLFFQKNDTGPYFRSFSWGHLVSSDLLNWKEVQPAIYPSENYLDNMYTFSGSCVVDKNGVPYLVYTGISSVGEMCSLSMAKPKDLNDPDLLEWEKIDIELKLPNTIYNKSQFRDPYVYVEDDVAYLIAVTQILDTGPCIVGWKSNLNNITKWEFCGTVFSVDKKIYAESGTMWELPQLYRLSSEDGITKYMFTMTPVPANGIENNCMYWLGDFDKNEFKFSSETKEATLLDCGNSFMCAGSGFVDPETNKVISFALAKCAEHSTVSKINASGWAGAVTLLREYSLNKDGTLSIKPYNGYSELHDKCLVKIENEFVENVDLKTISSRCAHIKMTINDYEDASKCGIRMFTSNEANKYVEFYYNVSDKKLCINTIYADQTDVKGYKYLDYKAKKDIDIDIFIDNSYIEIFVDGRIAMSTRVYMSNDCTGFQLIGEKWSLRNLEIFSMKNIYIE